MAKCDVWSSPGMRPWPYWSLGTISRGGEAQSGSSMVVARDLSQTGSPRPFGTSLLSDLLAALR